MTDYSELKRLAEDATPGPWGYDGSYVCPARVEGGTTYVESWRSVADCSLTENTKFIAAANPAAVLALIAENEALRLALESCADELEGQVIQCYHGIPVEDMHPVTRRAYDRDMAGVVEARSAMIKGEQA